MSVKVHNIANYFGQERYVMQTDESIKDEKSVGDEPIFTMAAATATTC